MERPKDVFHDSGSGEQDHEFERKLRAQLVSLFQDRKSRRELLKVGGLTGLSVSALWALACQPAAPAATPTKAPVSVAPTPTKAPAATPTPEKLGKQLMGEKPEGPDVITDPAKFPKTFKEAPPLAELVKAGKLPPVQERIGQDPMVLKPVYEIGKYGGIWRRGFTGPGDYINGTRISGPDMLIYLDKDLKTIQPNTARGYELSKDGLTFTVFLRRGMKWSDGKPFTADDFVFWFEDMYNNKALVPTPTARLRVDGKPVTVEKVDTYTVRWKFPAPYPFFPRTMSLFNEVSTHAQSGRTNMGSFAPAHYLKQFHPKYVGQEELDKKVKDLKFDNWVSLFKSRNTWGLTPELPTLSPWMTTTPLNTPVWTLERNPYSVWVDTEGNQLPYLDKIVMTLGETSEMINLRAIAGEYDMQARHIEPAKIPVLLQNKDKGNYSVALNPGQWGSDYGLKVNLNYDADPEVKKWLNNVDFRRALSLGIDRDQINEVFFLGLGVVGSCVPAESNPYFPGPEYRKLWATYDPKKANEMLDKIGLDKKDAEGFRLRTDGKGRLRLLITSVAASFIAFTPISEMVREHWKKIGIDVLVQDTERSLAEKRTQANENQLYTWTNDATDDIIFEASHVLSTTATDFMPRFGKWYATGGKEGLEPPAELRKAHELRNKAFTVFSDDERTKLGQEIWKIVADQLWYIGVAGQSGAQGGVLVTKNNMGNVPKRSSQLLRHYYPNNIRPQTFYWKS